jgi:hypothetical protein
LNAQLCGSCHRWGGGEERRGEKEVSKNNMMKEREDGKKKEKYQCIKLLRRLKNRGMRRKWRIEREDEDNKKLEED